MESVLKILGLVLVSGLGGAVANQLLSAWREHRADARAARLREADRQHERDMRLDEAHMDAAEHHAVRISEVRQWLEWSATEEHGAEYELSTHATPRPPSVGHVAQVAQRVAHIRDMHPTGYVRDRATRLYDELTGHFNQWEQIGPNIWDIRRASVDQYLDWQAQAEQIKEAILSPREV